MFSTVLGMFSQDLAVDLGTSNTRLYVRGEGVVCDEPTIVSVLTDRQGRREVIAIGREALPMLGREPDAIRTVRPVRGAQVDDYEVTDALLTHLVRRAHGRNAWIRPRMVITVPWGASEMSVRSLRESAERAGAREVQIVPRPLAAAFGAELAVDRPSGHMVVDIGGGRTEVSVLSLAGVVACVAIEHGGEAMDESIVRYLKRTHALLVGQPTAERLKRSIGSVRPGAEPSVELVKGRCLRRGVPRGVELGADELAMALAEHVDIIARAVRATLERTPPELASDVVDHGVVLTGGGAMLDGLDVALREATGLAMVRAEEPAAAVVRGAGQILEAGELSLRIAS